MDEITTFLNQLDDRLARIETILDAKSPEEKREWFTVSEVAELLGKEPFTVREWCRNHRINAHKRECGRGRSQEWIIAKKEVLRIREKGLLPLGLFK